MDALARHPNERIKADSDHLRGTLRQSLANDITGALHADDVQVAKFHGFYEQDDRDVRATRVERLLEPMHSFMLRARVPGGVCSSAQWLAIDNISHQLGNGTIRLTTRQTFQFHGILKASLKPLIQGIDAAMLDSIGGCGDVNRNVMCNPLPEQSSVHAEVYDWARRISEALLPATRAWHEIWLDEKPVAGGQGEPLYGDTYLPRKFKTAVAIPPHNDVDIYTNDLGFIAIIENDQLVGFNVTAGGGMGTTHGDRSTYPRLADTLGFVTPDKAIDVARAVLTTQRDYGDRVNRRLARLKYTVDSLGLDAFVDEVQTRAGIRFDPARPVTFTTQGDRYGWHSGSDDTQHLTLYIENGRVADTPAAALMTGLREIARIHQGDFRMTPSQNLIVANVPAAEVERIDALARQYGLLADGHSPTRLDSIACVALPTCPQAMAEAERYFPSLLTEIEALQQKHDIADTPIVIRMTGCPNGCARPFVAEIGLVGKAAGRYNLMLGGDGQGQRINALHRENLTEPALLEELDALFARYAAERTDGESFGDFVVNSGIIRAVVDPRTDYHA